MNKFDLELVTVRPDTGEGEPYRYLERCDSANVARTTADALVRRVGKHNSLRTHVVSDGPHSTALAYSDEWGIVGYANIAEVLGE